MRKLKKEEKLDFLYFSRNVERLHHQLTRQNNTNLQK